MDACVDNIGSVTGLEHLGTTDMIGYPVDVGPGRRGEADALKALMEEAKK